jgi:hypothetical protein
MEMTQAQAAPAALVAHRTPILDAAAVAVALEATVRPEAVPEAPAATAHRGCSSSYRSSL